MIFKKQKLSLRVLDFACFCSYFSQVLLIKKRAVPSQKAITCSKLTIETLEQGVQYVQS